MDSGDADIVVHLQRLAERLCEDLQGHGWSVQILRMSDYDPEDCLPAEVQTYRQPTWYRYLHIVVLSLFG